MAVRIRPARGSDLAGLRPLLAQLATDATAADAYELDEEAASNAIEAIERTEGNTLLVAEDDGRVVGTLHLVVVPNITHRGRPWAIVENIVVDGSRRRSGVGRALVDEAIARARRAGCYKVQLISRTERTVAHRLYAAAGFEPSAAGFRLYLDG